jgi:phosphoribosylaminoimidazole-succinocarboxamide synthase
MENRRDRTKRFLENLQETPILSIDNLPYKKIATGKVREIFDLDEDHLLIIATDRLSAFDVIMDQGIPGKGAILTQLSLFWFDQVKTDIPNHLPENHDERIDEVLKDFPQLQSRSMIVKKLEPLALEAVVRGYLAGSGWKDYKETGKLFQYDLPNNLQESSRLPEPLFTPTTKAQEGHDMPIDTDGAAEVVGKDTLDKIISASLDIYKQGVALAAKAGLILADTKFEFGKDREGNLYLIDEILTPDSSRYWPADIYEPGKSQPSYDKQFVRDFLENSGWNKTPPPPRLPEEVILGTREKYLAALTKLMS